MSIHYKFKNEINYDSIKFDGVWISAADLKSTIVQQKKLGQSELQLENEETRQIYTDDQQIPKNTNIIVLRLPSVSTKRTRMNASQPYPSRFSNNANSSGTTASGNVSHGQHSNQHHGHHNYHHNHHHHNRHHMNNLNSNNNRSNQPTSSSSLSSSTSHNNNNGADAGGGREAMELVSSKTMTEEEKIKYIQSQSTKDFDPSRYARGGRGGAHGRGGGGGYRHVPGPGYICRKCGIPGHLIFDCKSSSMHKVKRSSGIPRDFLMKVDSKEKGALMTPSGEYAVPYIDREAYNNPKVEKAPFFEDGTPSDDNVTSRF